MVAVCKDHADLKIARVIPRAGQRRDFPLGQLGRKPLQRRVGKTNRRHRAAQMRRTARGNRQWRKFSIGFQRSQIIRRIHLNHFCVNRSSTRDQTNFRRLLSVSA
jgi:hypothetical protein